MDDWKLFRSRIAKWQEDYMERLNKKYRKHPGVILSMSKSDMLYDVAKLVKDGVIGMEDLNDFSEKLQNEVRVILEM